MAEGKVTVAPDSTGKNIRTEEVTVAALLVEQQVITLADANGNLLLGSTASAGSLPVVIASDQAAIAVSGTVTANAGTGPATAWKVDLANTGANATAIKVDNSAVTQPVSGTVSIANLDVALSTRTKPADQQHTIIDTVTPTIKVDLSTTAANATAVKVDGSAVTQPVSGSVSVSNFPATQPVSGTVTANQGGAPWQENITQFGGNPVLTGTGTGGVGVPRVTVSSDSFPGVQAVTSTQFPTALGPATAANSLPVVMASDQSDVAFLGQLVSLQRMALQQTAALATLPSGFYPIEVPVIGG